MPFDLRLRIWIADRRLRVFGGIGPWIPSPGNLRATTLDWSPLQVTPVHLLHTEELCFQLRECEWWILWRKSSKACLSSTGSAMVGKETDPKKRIAEKMNKRFIFMLVSLSASENPNSGSKIEIQENRESNANPGHICMKMGKWWIRIRTENEKEDYSMVECWPSFEAEDTFLENFLKEKDSYDFIRLHRSKLAT